MWIAATTIFALCTALLGGYVWLQHTKGRFGKEVPVSAGSDEHTQHSRRRADNAKLSRRQLRRLQQAIDFIKDGNFEAGTQLLKNLGMLRRAIDLLIEAGKVPLAAGTLLHVNRVHRAGNLYALHGYWEEAARCFRKANMPLEEANCYRSKGDFIAAAQIYVINDRRLEAAHCYFSADQIDVAAEIFLEVGEFELAKKILDRLVKVPGGLKSLNLNRHAIESLRGLLAKETVEDIFIELFSIHNQLIPAIKALLFKDQLETAIVLLRKIPNDCYETLLKDPSITGDDAEKLAFVFLRAENISVAGIMSKHLDLLLEKKAANKAMKEAS